MSNAIKCLGVILVLAQGSLPALAAQLPTIDEVRAAYTKRAESIQSLRVELGHVYQDHRTPIGSTMSASNHYTYLRKGDSLRVDASRELINIGEGAPLHSEEYTRVFHDGEGTNWTKESIAGDQNQVELYSERSGYGVDEVRGRHLIGYVNSALMPFDSYIFERYPLEVVGTEQSSMGDLIVLRSPAVRPNQAGAIPSYPMEILVAPDLGYLPIESRMLSPDYEELIRADQFEYEFDRAGGITPTRVTSVRIDPDTKQVISSSIVEYANIEYNPEITDEDFRVELPQGTFVHDRDTGDRYVIGDEEATARVQEAMRQIEEQREIDRLAEETERDIATPTAPTRSPRAAAPAPPRRTPPVEIPPARFPWFGFSIGVALAFLLAWGVYMAVRRLDF